MKNRFSAWVTLSVLTAATSSCGLILGLEQDYQEKGGAGGSGSASTSSVTSGGSQATGSSSSSASGGGESGGPHCAGLPPTCGPNGDEDCCTTEPVPGGTFQRDNNTDSSYQATVSDFKLDRFEVTVGRFRKFVEAYPGSKPAAGAGKHPKIAEDMGWGETWSMFLPFGRAELETALKSCQEPFTWTDAAAGNEDKPINCVTWYEALAFCIWDGGRLPTEAEWSYAAIGGDEGRAFPWGADGSTPDTAVVNCEGDGLPSPDCKITDIYNVGSLPAGDARWKQADLAGSMFEWLRDAWDVSLYPKTPCVDCAILDAGVERVFRGGSWWNDYGHLSNNLRYPGGAGARFFDVGLRCARD